MKVGIMGGTFDPVHIAHLILAEEARLALELDRIIFIPAGSPWMKADRHITDASHRVAMLKLAIESNPSFCLSMIEIENPGWTYTVDTLERLVQELEAGTRLFLLIGWDGLLLMPQWKAPYRISKMATIVAFPRPGVQKPDMDILEVSMPGLRGRVKMMDSPFLDISSTQIRQRYAGGLSARYLVPDAVERYVVENGLYRRQ